MKRFDKEKINIKKLPEYSLAVAFFLFIIFTGYFSLKNYWEVKTSGVMATPDGYSVENEFEENFNILLWNENKYVEYYGLVAKLLGQPMLNETYKMDNGYLTALEPQVSEEMLQANADNMLELQQYLEQSGSKLLYVQTPYKVSKYDNQLPAGVTDYSNQNMDIFLEKLAGNGVDTIDMREEMYRDGINQYDYFYRTDHHWTTEGGFYAYVKIADFLEKEYGIAIDAQVKNIDNYRTDVYEQWHLGTNGQRTGIKYGGIDDFHVLVPEFDTAVVNVGTGQSGNFYDVLIEQSVLKEKTRAVYDLAYSRTLGGMFQSPNAANDATVLIVTDSMGKVVNPYMILSYKNVYTNGYNITKELLDTLQPDVVVYISYATNLAESNFDVIK